MHLRITNLNETEAGLIVAVFDQVCPKSDKMSPTEFVRNIVNVRIALNEHGKYGCVWIQPESKDSSFAVGIDSDGNEPLRRMASLICFVCDPDKEVLLGETLNDIRFQKITAQMATLLP